MRVVKDAKERKNEILDVAERLFCTKGFDNTSTNDILKEIGIARGTLYYHFKSKEEILDAMIERLSNEITSKATSIALDESIPVLKRITNTILSLNLDNDMAHMIMEQVHRPQNALLHQKMEESLLAKVNPLITKIIKDGINEGICKTKYPEEAVEMLMIYSNIVFDGTKEYDKENKERKVAGFIFKTKRILGMEEVSLLESMVPMVAK